MLKSQLLIATTNSVLLLLTLADLISAEAKKLPEVDRLLFITIAPPDANRNENFIRFNRSIEINELDLIVLNSRLPSKSNPDSTIYNKKFTDEFDSLRKALKVYKNDENLLIVWVRDSLQSIVNGNKKEILERFRALNEPIVFSGDVGIKKSEVEHESRKSSNGKHFRPYKNLNSNNFIGFAGNVWQLLDRLNLKFDQKIFDSTQEINSSIKIDHRAELFQPALEADLILDVDSDPEGVSLKNSLTATQPVIVYSTNELSYSSQSKIFLNALGNYLAKAWTKSSNCRYCDKIKLSFDVQEEIPTVLIGLFIEEPTPFLEAFFESVLSLEYPRDRIQLYIHNSIDYHRAQVIEFVDQVKDKYANISSSTIKDEAGARTEALLMSQRLGVDFYLSLDSLARLDETESLRVLIESNRTILAPLLVRTNKLWSNYWGSMDSEYYYLRSFDYLQLVNRERVGIWNVAHIMNAYLINVRNFFANFLAPETERNFFKCPGNLMKPNYFFTLQMRVENLNLFMINTIDFGHLIDPDNYNISLKHPDFYQLRENTLEWEQVYLHENYSYVLENDSVRLEQPCQDVFWFPLVSETFCHHLIGIMESFGQWSGGTNEDPRIAGGYESVPTRDIHLKQVDLHEMWLEFLRDYVMPIQLKEFIGYDHDPPQADLAFVVRYHPAEQASLMAHHDSSTYTMNIALNSPGKDYTGGGCRFLRYNCSVVDSRQGWALIHPGRLTHYHEGLQVFFPPLEDGEQNSIYLSE